MPDNKNPQVEEQNKRRADSGSSTFEDNIQKNIKALKEEEKYTSLIYKHQKAISQDRTKGLTKLELDVKELEKEKNVLEDILEKEDEESALYKRAKKDLEENLRVQEALNDLKEYNLNILSEAERKAQVDEIDRLVKISEEEEKRAKKRQEYIEAEKEAVRELNNEIEDNEQALKDLKKEENSLQGDNSLEAEIRRSEIRKERAERENRAEDLETEKKKKLGEDVETKEKWQKVSEGLAEGFKSTKGFGLLGDFFEGVSKSRDVEKKYGSFKDLPMVNLDSKMGKVVSIVDKVGNMVISIANALKDKLLQYVENAASVMSKYWGQVNANLYGFKGLNSQIITDAAQERLSFSGIVKMEDYLNNIKALTDAGIAYDVESIALLTTIKDKTISQFNASSGYLRQLVRLGAKQATEKYFGLAAILKKALNAQFGDNSYLNNLFDSVNSTIKDSMVNLSDNAKSVYGYAGIINAYAGAMYESGMEEGTVNKIVTAVNALGSGNVQSLSSDEGMMKLILLAMNQGGMNLADLLQGGLSATSAEKLLANVVEYVADIATTTKNNNVLEASYANTFGLSMSDMKAFINVQNSKILSKQDVTSNKIDAAVNTQLSALSSSDRRLVSEKIDNIMTNMQFGFGSDIAGSPAKYRTFKYSSVAMDLASSLSKYAGPNLIAQGILKGVQLAASAAMLTTAGLAAVNLAADGIKEVIGIVKDDENTVQQLFDDVSKRGGYTPGGGGNYKENKNELTTVTKNEDGSYSHGVAKKYIDEADKKFKEIKDEDWEKEEENYVKKILEKLQEYDGILMENKTTKTKAIAVSLEGMANDVLRSFASIFADEDSMTEVMKNKEFVDRLFEFDDNSTTSSSRQAIGPDGKPIVQQIVEKGAETLEKGANKVEKGAKKIVNTVTGKGKKKTTTVTKKGSKKK